MVYRIKQFLRAIKSWFFKINDSDIIYVKKYISEEQFQLFDKLSNYDKRHSVYVAKDIEKNLKRNITCSELEILIKTALLHDIGKIYKRLNIFDRVLIVIMDSLFKEKIKDIKIKAIKEKINVYYNHPQLGYELLKNCTDNEEILYLIRNHHNKNVDYYRLKIFQEFDEKN